LKSPKSAVAASSFRSISVLVPLAMLITFGDPHSADARGKPRDCKPNGLPIALGTSGAIEVAEPLDYMGESRVLAADKRVKPSKLQLISLTGEAIALPNPPWTLEPSRWLTRGRAVYTVGTGRSQTEGKTDVVLVRWGTDSRPRLTKVATIDRVVAPPRAALVGEYLAVLWAEPVAGGSAHVRATFLDVEELKFSTAQDLGPYESGGFLDIVPAGKGFSAVWASGGGVKRKNFDLHGKSDAAPAALQWKDASAVRSALICGDRLWLLHDGGTDKLAVSTSDASGVTNQVARLATSSEMQRWPMLCADDSVIVAHRTVHPKAGNVVFWITTVEPSGKTRERRVKDIQGTADSIRMPLLAAAGESRSAFWVEGAGPAAKLWSREIVCE
jgi:hypothetical protein